MTCQRFVGATAQSVRFCGSKDVDAHAQLMRMLAANKATRTKAAKLPQKEPPHMVEAEWEKEDTADDLLSYVYPKNVKVTYLVSHD